MCTLHKTHLLPVSSALQRKKQSHCQAITQLINYKIDRTVNEKDFH